MSTILTTKTNSIIIYEICPKIKIYSLTQKQKTNRTKSKLLNQTEITKPYRTASQSSPPPFQICWVTTTRRKISKQSSYGYGDQSFSPPPRILIICSRIFLPLWRSSRPHGLVTLLFLIRIRVKSAQKFRTKRTLRNLSSLASLFDLVC